MFLLAREEGLGPSRLVVFQSSSRAGKGCVPALGSSTAWACGRPERGQERGRKVVFVGGEDGWFDFSAFRFSYFPFLFLPPCFFLLPNIILFGRLPWRRRRGHAWGGAAAFLLACPVGRWSVHSCLPGSKVVRAYWPASCGGTWVKSGNVLLAL